MTKSWEENGYNFNFGWIIPSSHEISSMLEAVSASKMKCPWVTEREKRRLYTVVVTLLLRALQQVNIHHSGNSEDSSEPSQASFSLKRAGWLNGLVNESLYFIRLQKLWNILVCFGTMYSFEQRWVTSQPSGGNSWQPSHHWWFQPRLELSFCSS